MLPAVKAADNCQLLQDEQGNRGKQDCCLQNRRIEETGEFGQRGYTPLPKQLLPDVDGT